MIYVFAVCAALVVATGEVIQQRSAAQAPPEDNLSIRLLIWLVQRPRWLGGVACSFAGNALFALALHSGGIIRVESVFVIRLVFGLVIAAFWGWHRVPVRDLVGALAITAGMATFLLVGQPHRSQTTVPPMRWVEGAGSLVFLAVLLAVIASRLPSIRRAPVLGAGAGTLFGVQASLVQSAVAVITAGGILSLLTTWNGYTVVVVALTGMLIVQSAFEAAPLAASYPAIVTSQLLSSIVVGLWVLGGTLRIDPVRAAVMVVALLVMIGGIFMLTRSPIVTGQLASNRRRRGDLATVPTGRRPDIAPDADADPARSARHEPGRG